MTTKIQRQKQERNTGILHYVQDDDVNTDFVQEDDGKNKQQALALQIGRI